MTKIAIPQTIQEWNERGKDYLPGLLGLEVISMSSNKVEIRLPVQKSVLSWNGFLHAGTVVSLADTACGYGTFYNLPEDAFTFTTVELKSNFLGTALEGSVFCTATPAHMGRSTQVWDAVVKNETSGKTIALFRCTQMILRR